MTGESESAPRRRQIEAAARALGDDLEESHPDEEKDRLKPELAPLAGRTRGGHQRRPRQRRVSSARKVKARKAPVKRTR